MRKFQDDTTTPEQSKRLLELGVPADSAGCYLNGDSVIMLNGKTFQENYNEDLDLARLHLIEYPHYTPCWSVGRLIEIFCICTDDRYSIEFLHRMPQTIIEKTIGAIESFKLDFSKLEE